MRNAKWARLDETQTNIILDGGRTLSREDARAFADEIYECLKDANHIEQNREYLSKRWGTGDMPENPEDDD